MDRCAVAGVKISTSESEAMVPCWKSLWVWSELLQRVKHLNVMSMVRWSMRSANESSRNSDAVWDRPGEEGAEPSE